MFAKIFSQIFDSSIAEDYNCRRMFMDLLVLADSDGCVDMTHEAIARRTNVPISEVKKYLVELGKPDPASRSKEEEGRRIIHLKLDRDWGWRIVNYDLYRSIINEESRRAYFRDKQAQYRERKRSGGLVKDVKKCETLLNDVKDNSKVLKEITHAYMPLPLPLVITDKYNSGSKEQLKEIVEQIYQEYPRKVAKPDAVKAITRAVAKFDPEFLLERTKAYAKTQVPVDKFTPHPATWFNQERFNDDPKTWNREGEEPKFNI